MDGLEWKIRIPLVVVARDDRDKKTIAIENEVRWNKSEDSLELQP